MSSVITYAWRGSFANDALNALHSEAFSLGPSNDDWWTQVNDHSLGWICAHRERVLVGFLNVAWDGRHHAFVLDTIVARSARRQGIATEMVKRAAGQAKAAGCEWLHVDFEAPFRELYVARCGFTPTAAGLIRLNRDA